MQPLNPGILKHRLIVLVSTTSDNEYSEPVRTWATSGSPRPCHVLPLTTREIMRGGRVRGVRSYKITLRYASDVDERNRVTLHYGGRDIVLAIDAVTSDEHLTQMTLLAYEAEQAEEEQQ